MLLDFKFNAYLGDFGMAQLLEHNKKAHTTFVVGTMAYLALELLHTRKANTKTYIFNFGVLMLDDMPPSSLLDTKKVQLC